MSTDARLTEIYDALQTELDGHSVHRTDLDGPAVFSSWSAAHHALGLLHLDPARAASELRAIYHLCQRPDGLVALEVPLDDSARTARVAEVGEIYGEDGRSVLTSPPVAAYAAARVASAIGEAGRDLLERSAEHLDAIWGERLPPDTPLPVILHPLESGAFGSPLFAEVIEATDAADWADETNTLVRSAVACTMDPDRALRAGHPFVVEDPMFCGWFLLALEEGARAWERVSGAEAQVTKLRIRIEMIARGIVERLWWDGEELFVAGDRARQKPLRAVTLGGLMPTACRSILEESDAKQAVERHLRPGVTPLWGANGISFNPISRDEAHDPARVAWQGNCMSPYTHYWAHLALTCARRSTDARAARTQLEALIDEAGSREFYDGLTREGYGGGQSSGHGSAGLLLEMRAREDSV